MLTTANRVLLGALILLGLWVVYSGLWIGVQAWAPTPLWDQWDHIAPEQLKGALFGAHNEHRIILTTALAWVDIALVRRIDRLRLSFQRRIVGAAACPRPPDLAESSA
jgi:hypothetical protein